VSWSARARYLGQWPVALAIVAVLAAVILLPGLGSFGLWEMQERQLSDKQAPRAELQKDEPAPQPPKLPANAQPAPQKPDCERTVPKDAVARSLTPRAARFGRDTFGDSDAGRRFPFALLGFITALAIAGTAMRLAGPRAGILAGIIALSFPLLTLQSRQLTSEIGTPAGGALIIYGLVALGGRGFARDPKQLALGAGDAILALVSIVAGVALGFAAGGALLGVLVPVGAYAAAGALGVPGIVTLGKLAWQAIVRAGGTRFGVGRKQSLRETLGEHPIEQLKVLLAAIAAVALIVTLFFQMYDLKDPIPGATPVQRQILGKVIAPSACYSSALGAVWRVDDDLRYIWDSTFEQIAYGTFPWGLLAPIAFAALLASPDRKRRMLGGICVAWAGAAWIANEAFLRKVGFTIWAGFPALAIASGAWLDGMFSGRARDDRDAMPAGAILIAVFVALGVLDLGKDLQSFSERLSSLLVGNDAIPYPTQSRFLFIPTRLWVLILGVLAAIGFAIAMTTWRAGDDARARKMKRVSTWAAASMIGLTVAIGAFWAFGWQPRLAVHVSSKAMFETYNDLVEDGDQLVIMGDMGDAPHDYTDGKFQSVTSRADIVSALGRPNRVFAVAPNAELCSLHREIGGKPYYILDDRNARSLLLSNKLDGATDKNPLRDMIVHAEPQNIPVRAKGRIVFDNKIQLLGWDIPKAVGRGDKVEMKLYYKILAPVGAVWKTLVHLDGYLKINGDHPPIQEKCQTSTWQPGDYIIDTFTVQAGGGASPSGKYEVWTGFFTGAAPNWRNMPVSEAPGEMRDNSDRVKITSILLE
jgi:hypothetical protein